jgi:hypothetical protein
MTPATKPRFCAHLFFTRKGILESLVIKAPSLEEIKALFVAKLVANTGRPNENFNVRARLIAKDTPFHIWDITCARTDAAWVKVHKIAYPCPPGWKT